MFFGQAHVYFWMMAVAGFGATAALAAGGRIAFMIGMLLLAIGAVVMRGWTLKRIDARQDAYQACDSAAKRRLRMVHWDGMAANILVAVTGGSSVPHIL